MERIALRTGTDTDGLRAALDAAGMGSVAIVSDEGGPRLEVPDDVSGLAARIEAENFYRASLVAALGGEGDFEGAVVAAVGMVAAFAEAFAALDLNAVTTVEELKEALSPVVSAAAGTPQLPHD